MVSKLGIWRFLNVPITVLRAGGVHVHTAPTFASILRKSGPETRWDILVPMFPWSTPTTSPPVSSLPWAIAADAILHAPAGYVRKSQ